MKKTDLKFKLTIFAIVIGGIIACLLIISSIKGPTITETPEGIPYATERTVEENEEFITKNNMLGAFAYEVPSDFETSNFSYEQSQRYSNGTDLLNVSYNPEDEIQDYRDLFEGEDKTIGKFDGFYYLTNVEGVQFYEFLFEYNNILYTVESTSEEVLNNFVNSLKVLQ